MRRSVLASVGCAVMVASGVGLAAPASAFDALNGSFTAYSDGGLGTRNDVSYGWNYPYPDVTQVLTFTTSCVLDDCHGTVSSSDGWTAPAERRNGRWWITYQRPDGILCADGTFVDTKQSLAFDMDSLLGTDMMQGPSGACNRNSPIVIKRPLTLAPIG